MFSSIASLMHELRPLNKFKILKVSHDKQQTKLKKKKKKKRKLINKQNKSLAWTGDINSTNLDLFPSFISVHPRPRQCRWQAKFTLWFSVCLSDYTHHHSNNILMYQWSLEILLWRGLGEKWTFGSCWCTDKCISYLVLGKIIWA